MAFNAFRSIFNISQNTKPEIRETNFREFLQERAASNSRD